MFKTLLFNSTKTCIAYIEKEYHKKVSKVNFHISLNLGGV